MTLLVDWQIRKLVQSHQLLDPFSEGVQDGGIISFGLTHSGYDLRLGHSVLIFKNTRNELISPKRMKSDDEYMGRIFDKLNNLVESQPVVIPPHGYILGYSLEYIRMPLSLSGTCVGKSSLARCGVVVNTTPLEPGWQGHLTLEIANVTPSPIEIYVGEGIAQLRLERLDALPEKSYADKQGKYDKQGAIPVPAKVKE